MKNNKKINWKILLLSLVIVYFVAFIGSLFTSGNTDSEWYESTKPKITPPNLVFPIVWNILFLLISLSLYLSWKNAGNSKTGRIKQQIALVFGINFILNILWSVFYFYLKNPLLAFFDLILLWISITAMIYVSRKSSRTAAWLLVLYLLWVSFAGILNYLSI